MTYVAYYRVSTDRQGVSGLGLEAQQQAVRAFLGEDPTMSFIEVESGAKSDRPQLTLALEYCKKHKHKLVIAKLDRLSRNVHFISGLMESGVDFVSLDNPHGNRLMSHLLAAFAEYERSQISSRIKAAYDVYEGDAWGVVSVETIRKRREKKLSYLLSVLEHLDKTPEELEALGIKTARGQKIRYRNLARMRKDAEELLHDNKQYFTEGANKGVPTC